jgi:transposase
MRELAVRLVAEDRLNDVDIAAQIGISVRQLQRWKQKPEFRALVERSCDKYQRRRRGRAARMKCKIASDEGTGERREGGMTAMELARSRLTGNQRKAAALVAQGLSSAEIGRRCCVSRGCIQRWKRRPEFYAEVIEHWEAWGWPTPFSNKAAENPAGQRSQSAAAILGCETC